MKKELKNLGSLGDNRGLRVHALHAPNLQSIPSTTYFSRALLGVALVSPITTRWPWCLKYDRIRCSEMGQIIKNQMLRCSISRQALLLT